MNHRIIVSGIIEKEIDGKKNYLFGRKPKGVGPYPDCLHLIGGGVEDFLRAKDLVDKEMFDDSYLHAELRREAREEAGVEIGNIRWCEVGPDQKIALNKNEEQTHYTFLVYFCSVVGGVEKAGDDLASLHWVARDVFGESALTPPSIELFKKLGWI